jgi:hypothetical protein
MKTSGSMDLKNKTSKDRPGQRNGRWGFVLFYLAILFLGLLTIELRVGPIWGCGRLVERVPSLAAVFNWIFYSDQMGYVAVSDLKVNHHLQPEDLTINPKLDRALHDFVPKPGDIVDRYLRSDLAAGSPVLPQNLSRTSVIAPRSDSYVVGVRLGLQPTSTRLLEPDSKIVLTPLNSTEKLDGTIVSGRWEKPFPSTTKTTEVDKQNPESKGATNQLSPSPRAEPTPQK